MEPRPIVYMVQGEKTSPVFCHAFAKGCKGTLIDRAELQPGPVAMFGSPILWPVLERARREGRTWYYGDHSYYTRKFFYRITKNTLQHDGRGGATPHRFRALKLQIRPWRKSGSHILVCPPGELYCILNGFSADRWRLTVKHKLRCFTDREIRFRSKPSQRQRGEPLRKFTEDLKDCWALVTYRSNTAVAALRLGVPVFCTGQCAASRMGHDDLGLIEKPYYPDDREQFLWNLADNEWDIYEIANGTAWRRLNQ